MKMPDALHRLLGALYPATGCALCARPDALPLCSACRSTLLRHSVTRPCPQCGRPTPDGQLCRHCGRGQFFCTRAVAGLSYAPPVRKAIAAYKFHHRRDLTDPLCDAMLFAATPLPLGQIDLLVSVPAQPLRTLVRGYNPAALLAEELSARTGIPVRHDVLRRRGFAPPSYRRRLDPMQRMRRAGRQYGPGAALPPGARVLLVDDVCTTGATLSACALQLKAAGASAVYGIVAAAVPLHRG